MIWPKSGQRRASREQMLPTFINSNGQSGTNLAKKCLSLLGGEQVGLSTNATVGRVPTDRPAYDQPDFDPSRHILCGVFWPGYIEANTLQERFAPRTQSGRWGASHMLYTPAGAAMFAELGMKVILIVREPRDWVYSVARKISENPEPFGRTKDTTLREHIEDSITGFPASETVGRLSAHERYRRMADWQAHPFVLTIRFEDLVGTRGGGSDARSSECLEQIADHIAVPLSAGSKQHVLDNLFGDTKTFRKGQIGTWREVADVIEPYDHELRRAGELFGYCC